MSATVQPTPCHQCGGPALVQYLRSGWRVMCYDLEARTSCQAMSKNSWVRQDAIAYWNEMSDSPPAGLEAPKELEQQQPQEQEEEVDLTEALFA